MDHGSHGGRQGTIWGMVDLPALDELRERFRHARRAALRHTLEESSAEETEVALRERATTVDASNMERYVFENSRAVGLGYVRFHKVRVGLAELPKILSVLDSPCFEGVFSFESEEPSLRLLRDGCEDSAHCNFWREALAGLVVGLTGLVVSRHESRGAGCARCVDAIHPRVDGPSAFAPLSEELLQDLSPICDTVRRFDPSASLQFLGSREGVIYYLLSRKPGGTSLSTVIERAALKRRPGIFLREFSARSPFD